MNKKLYEEVDLTEMKGLIQPIINNLVGQYQDHLNRFLGSFNETNSRNSEHSRKLVCLLLESTKLLLELFNETIQENQKFTKNDFLKYIYSFNIPTFNLNNNIYDALFGLLKREFNDEEWEYFKLTVYQYSKLSSFHYFIANGRLNTGELNIDVDQLIDILDKNFDYNKLRSERLTDKIQFTRQYIPLLDNHFDNNWEPFNRLFQNNIGYLTDRLEWINANEKLDEKDKILIKK